MTIVMFWDAISMELARAIPTATVIWRVLLFFVGSAALLVMIMPWEQVPHDGSSPFAAAFDRFGIPAAETIMNIVVLTAVVSVLNSGLYIASRMLFAMRDHGWAPSWVGDTRSRLWLSLISLAAVLLAYTLTTHRQHRGG
jgi:GABA permease